MMKWLSLFVIFLLCFTFANAEIEEVMLLPFSHCDIGFTQTLDTVAMNYKDNIDEAIALIEKYDDFYWTIESLWQLEQWMLRSTDKEIDHLRELIIAGRIEVCGMYSTQRSGLMGIEDANRMLYPMRRIQERLKIPVYTVMQNDVPGYADVFPRVLSSAGIKYFLTGVNLGFGGGTTIPRKENPFYWQSMNGDKVLTWIDYDGYVSVWPWGLNNIFEAEQKGLPDGGTFFIQSIKNLEKDGYPYKTFMLMSAMGDNKNPRAMEPFFSLLSKWNAEGKKPTLRFATPKMFFEKILQEADQQNLKTYKGNWHGLWDARTWNPAGNILGRWAQQNLPLAETLESINTIQGFISSHSYDFNEGFMALYKHIEHTCGGDPGWLVLHTEEEVKRENVLTLRFAQDAYYSAARGISENMQHLSDQMQTDKSSIIIFNPLQWKRSALVNCNVSRDLINKSFKLLDSVSGESIPHTLEPENALLTFFATDLPAVGYKKYTVEVMDAAEASPYTKANKGNTIENKFYRIKVDKSNGAIESIFDKTAERELVDKKTKYPFNAINVTRNLQLAKGEPGETKEFNCNIQILDGPGYKRLIISREGTFFPSTVITLPDDLKQINISNTLDRYKMPYVSAQDHSDYYNFVFPFALKEEKLSIYVDGPDGFYQYPENYLPGAYLGAIQSQFGIHLQEGDNFGITIAHPQSFNWCVGEFYYHRQATEVGKLPPSLWSEGIPRGTSIRPLKPLLFSTAVQYVIEGETSDIGITKFRETEPGTDPTMTFEYSFTTNIANFDSSQATKFCRQAVIRPFAYYDGLYFGPRKGALKEPTGSFLTIEPDNVLMTAFKRAEFGDSDEYILRFKELQGKETEVTVQMPFRIANAVVTDILEQPLPDMSSLNKDPIHFIISPYSVQTIRVQFAKQRE